MTARSSKGRIGPFLLGALIALLIIVGVNEVYLHSGEYTVSGLCSVSMKWEDTDGYFLLIHAPDRNYVAACSAELYDAVICDPDVAYTVQLTGNRRNPKIGDLKEFNLDDYIDNRTTR